MAEAQKPLELILARNLLSSISTPAFLVDAEGMLVFFNEAAGALVGRRFERMNIHNTAGDVHEIEVSALPIVGTGGFRGAMAIFWPVEAGASA